MKTFWTLAALTAVCFSAAGLIALLDSQVVTEGLIGDALTSAIQTRLNYNVISTFALIAAAVGSFFSAVVLFVVTQQKDKPWASWIR